MTDLNAPGVCKALSKRILEDIDECCVKLYDDGHRTHLGASLIGDECKRKLWYVFRWVKRDEFKSSKQGATNSDHKANHGRILRLFNRGHREEDRFIEWLEGIGVQVWADDLTNNSLIYHQGGDYELVQNPYDLPLSSDDVSDSKEHIAIAKVMGLEFPQYRISDVNGHFGGSLDGIGRLPERYGIEKPVLLEFKTINEKGHKKLQKDGMIVEKPSHYAQTSTYGFKYSIEHCLYLSTHKDTDDIHAEVVKLDHNLGKQMLLKAEQVICSQEAPPKLSLDPTYFKCKFCSFSEICHKGAICEKNCRSCKYAFPAQEKMWLCSQNGNKPIPKEFIPNGCTCYEAITNNVC